MKFVVVVVIAADDEPLDAVDELEADVLVVVTEVGNGGKQSSG